jgi:hypothetical protein
MGIGVKVRQDMRQDFFGIVLAGSQETRFGRGAALTVGEIHQLNPIRGRLSSLGDLETESLSRR